MGAVDERERTEAASPERWRFTVEDYHRMGEAGIFTEDDRIELIEGEILTMTPIGARHIAYVNRLARLFYRRLDDRSIVSMQNSIRLSNSSEPQPDIVLLRDQSNYYEDRLSEPGDILLVVEVSDTTLAYDRGVKAPLYARHSVRETWIVDLAGGVVEVHADPGPDGYGSVTIRRRGETISPGAFPDVSIPVDEILGPEEASS